MINSAKNCRSYNSFISVSSDYRIISAEICLSIRTNKNKVYVNTPFDWTRQNYDNDIRNNLITEVINRCTALQETDTTDS